MAVALRQLGDLPAALEIEEKVHQIRSMALPEDHPDLQLARNNLAVTRKELGDLQGALTLEVAACKSLSRFLPDSDPELQRVRHNLTATYLLLGDWDSARQMLAALIKGTLVWLEQWSLTMAPREIEALATSATHSIDEIVSLSTRLELDPEALTLVERVRASSSSNLALRKLVDQAADQTALRNLLEDVSLASASVLRACASGRGELYQAVQAEDAAQRRLQSYLTSLPQIRASQPRVDLEAIAGSLTDREAAVGYWRYHRVDLNEEKHRLVPLGAHYLAYVIRKGVRVNRIELGSAEVIEAAVERWRNAAHGAGHDRGARPLETPPGALDEAAGTALRALILDPILAVTGGSECLVIAADGALHQVAFDALPLAGRIGQLFHLPPPSARARKSRDST
jgi:hypothetical protein